MEADYGHMVSTADADILTEDALPGAAQTPDTEMDPATNELWNYQKLGTFYGVRVADCDRGLPIRSADMLMMAFTIRRTCRSLILYMSPDLTENSEKYEQLLQRVNDREVVIVDEQKQYDPSRGCFIVWVRYDELTAVLNDRYQYLREELCTK